MKHELVAAARALSALLEIRCKDDEDLQNAVYMVINGDVVFEKQNGDRVTLNELIGDGNDFGNQYNRFIGMLPEDNDQNLRRMHPQRRTFGAGSDDDAVVDDTDVTENISGDVSKNVLAHAIFATKNLSLNDEKTIKVCVGNEVFDPDNRDELAAARDHLLACLQRTLSALKEKSPFVSGKPSAMLTKKILRLSNLIKDFERTKKTRGIFKKKDANTFDPVKLFGKAVSAGVRFVAEEFENQAAYHSGSEIDLATLVRQILNLVHKHASKKDITNYISKYARNMSVSQLESFKNSTADLFNQNILELPLDLTEVDVAKMKSGLSYVEKTEIVEALAKIKSSMSPDGPDTMCEYFEGSIYNRYYQKAIKKDVSDFKEAISKKKGNTVTIEELKSEARKHDLEIKLSTDEKEETDNQTYNDTATPNNAPLVSNDIPDVDDNSDNGNSDVFEMFKFSDDEQRKRLSYSDDARN